MVGNSVEIIYTIVQLFYAVRNIGKNYNIVVFLFISSKQVPKVLQTWSFVKYVFTYYDMARERWKLSSRQVGENHWTRIVKPAMTKDNINKLLFIGIGFIYFINYT